MSNFETTTAIPIKDVMSSSVITVREDDNIELVAKLMTEHDVGSIVVIDSRGYPSGMITERDLVIRVTAKNYLPKKIKSKEVMSIPLRTIDLNVDIQEAAKRMQKYSIRRLIVLDKDKMVGIISSKDIVAITPALIEIIMEKARITQGLPPIKETSSSGYCDRCRQWSDPLVNKEGKFICEDCRIELEAE